jgi:ABC-2 type transport system permease protein
MRRYLRLLVAQLRASAVAAAQYRVEFFVDGAVEILWTFTTLAPLFVVYGQRTTVAGWTFGEALVVVAFFTLLQALLEGVMNPSFVAMVEHVRRGTLDYVLLMPADAQFLVSTGRFHLWRAINAATAILLFGVAFFEVGRVPSVSDLVLGMALFAAAALLLHALWTLAMCTVFFAVKTDQITDILTAILDGARWPSDVFRGGLRLVLTFVIPLGLMTTAPATVLLGHWDRTLIAAAVGEAILASAVARAAWTRSLARYSSASS